MLSIRTNLLSLTLASTGGEPAGAATETLNLSPPRLQLFPTASLAWMVNSATSAVEPITVPAPFATVLEASVV